MGKLTAVAVKNAKPGVHQDGDGLALRVLSAESARWAFRYQIAGKRRDMGLGPARGPGAVTLAEAREKVAVARRLLREGIDPLDHRARLAAEAEAVAAETAAQEAAAARTFEVVARDYVAAHEAGWSNAKHRAQWLATLETYAFPTMGAVPVADVALPHVLDVLRPLWSSTTETASRLRGRIESILDYARVQGWREGANPAQWRGNLDHLLPRKSRIAPVGHQPALPYADLPRFMRTLRRKPGNGARCLEFVILTACRSGEARLATWREVDMAAAAWTIPAGRMKAKREHRVALSPAALDILRDQLPDGGKPDPEALIFPGQRQGKPLSEDTLRQLVRGMALDGLKPGEPPRWRDANDNLVTPHGFRSTFRDWAGEETHHPREVVEAALAHTLESKVEAAYRRGDAFEKRRVLMADWATYCMGRTTSDDTGLPWTISNN